MAQDDRKGQPPVTRGKSPAPTAPDTPSARDLNAPPPPEAPDSPSAPPAAEAPPAPKGAAGALAAAKESETERLLREVKEAKESLKAKEDALSIHEAQRKVDDAATAMVNDYKAEIPALEALEKGLRQYQAAETNYLETVLPASTITAIKEVDKAPRKKIDDLRVKIEHGERDAAEARRDLAEARAEATAAEQRSEALKRPAVSIRDRLKGADAVRADAKKASDTGNYALAYWLVREGGKLDQAMAGPEKTKPQDLAAEIRKAAAEQAKADKAVEALENRVKELDSSLQEDRAELATSQRTVDATILTELAKLNPPSVEAA